MIGGARLPTTTSSTPTTMWMAADAQYWVQRSGRAAKCAPIMTSAMHSWAIMSAKAAVNASIGGACPLLMTTRQSPDARPAYRAWRTKVALRPVAAMPFSGWRRFRDLGLEFLLGPVRIGRAAHRLRMRMGLIGEIPATGVGM